MWQDDTVCRVCRRRAPRVKPSLFNCEPENEFQAAEQDKEEDRRLTVRTRRVGNPGRLDQRCGGGRRVVRKKLGNS